MSSVGVRCNRCFGNGHNRGAVGSLVYWVFHLLFLALALPTGGLSLLGNLTFYLFGRSVCPGCGGTGFSDEIVRR